MKKNFIIILSLFVFFIGGCGGTNDEDTNSNGETLKLVATNWEFDKEEYKVPHGEVSIILENKEGHHGIIIENTDIEIKEEGQVTANLEAGEYTV
ncbi:cytochrome C oxidase subunit II [Pseudalkalibacillus sp. A8]|uniref:cytochrome C oxidase subunit II n=1 Tax=Pseudalkalibacillus sp. A8 TaxID=3382641 RepID=UPI0038B49F9A